MNGGRPISGAECDSDRDGDTIMDACDQCPDDPAKIYPGICGCGVPDTDSDADGVADCRDNCELPNHDQTDCQPNGVGDVCDIDSGSSQDVNLDSIPDECEDCLFDVDCDDGIFCNGFEPCVAGTCVAGEWPCLVRQLCVEDLGACVSDCNTNGISDLDDIENGVSYDCDDDHVPDECESGDDLDGGSIVTWGYRGSAETNVPAPNTGFIAVAAGDGHGLGLKADGSIAAWGLNDYGQTNVPVPNTEFIVVAAGGRHSLGVKAYRSIFAWGWNLYGQCNVPAPNADFVAVAGGGYHSLGLKTDGSIVAWGLNDYGQTNVPAPNTGFIAVAAGYYHSLGLKTDGSIVAWGNNQYGPINVPAPNTGFVAVAGGGYTSLGVKANGSIVAWGSNLYGQCNVPMPNSDFVAAATGHYHSVGAKANGSIVAWGCGGMYTNYGQCAFPAPNAGFLAVAAGGIDSLAIRSGGACCVANATCLQLDDQSQCDAENGTFRGFGSSCQQDQDGDLIADTCDNCVCTSNSSRQNDFDSDGFGDACDGCPFDALKQAPGICGCGRSEVQYPMDAEPDCDVDLENLRAFIDCLGGPGTVSGSACHVFLSDADDDIDLVEVAVFQRVFTGAP